MSGLTAEAKLRGTDVMLAAAARSTGIRHRPSFCTGSMVCSEAKNR